MREMTITNLGTMQDLRAAARCNPRRRIHRVLHRDEAGQPDFGAALQALVVAGVPDTYVMPHRFDRDQCFAVLTGEWGFLFWDLEGRFTHAKICAPGEVIHIPTDTGYHTWVCLQPGTLLETLPGPHSGGRHDLPDYPVEGTESAARVLRSWEDTLGAQR